MTKIIRHTVSTEIEQKILTGMIVNDEYCTKIQKMIKVSYFQNTYARIVLGWIQDYFKGYKKSPGKQIQDVYRAEKDNLKEADVELIGTFLSNLSANYETSTSINYEYLIDQTRDYFRERSLTILSEKVRGELGRGKIDGAEQAVKNFSKVVKNIVNWENPFERASINENFNAQTDVLFRLPGELGEMAGYFEREWLVAFISPMKRGKSWMLQEFAIDALSARLKVAFFSLEMNQRAMSERIYKRMTALSEKEGEISWPVFDCEKNQDNTCKRKDRISPIGIKDPGVEIPEFRKVRGYKPCIVCKELKNGEYRQAIWREWQEPKQKFDAKFTVKKVKDFERLYGSNFRIKSYPAFSATFDDIISDIEDLDYTEGFVPDIICIDYIDIMAPEGQGELSERGKIDWAWKRAKGLAAQRHCLVATVLQGNRASITQKNVQQENTSEDIRKLAHVDVMFGLNQLPEEKEMGVMRISMVAHRHEKFSSVGKEVLILQSFEIGQPIVDMAWDTRNKKSKRRDKKND
jgi:hypothetical protein